jgi:hypothetical protein
VTQLLRLVTKARRPRIRARLLLAVPFFITAGCATPTQKVATAQVARDFYRARYDETCPHVRLIVPAWCGGYDISLNVTDGHLREANAALVWYSKSKAKMPLQLKAIDKDVKALKKGYKP